MPADRQLKKKPSVSAQELAVCYHLWLGVPDSEFPPSAHRLLGIPKHETDKEVIRDGFIRQERYVKKYLKTDQKITAKRVLKNLRKAELALLNRLASQQPDAVPRIRESSSAASWPWLDTLLKTATIQLILAITVLSLIGILKYFTSYPSTRSGTVTTNATSRPPDFVRYEAISIEAGRELRFSPFVVDPAGPRDKLAYRLLDGSPANAKIDPETGLITWPTGGTFGKRKQQIKCSATQSSTGLSTSIELSISLVPKQTPFTTTSSD